MWCREHTMTEYPYILFNKSPEQMHHLGACGGRAYGRNQRAPRGTSGIQTSVVSSYLLDTTLVWIPLVPRGARAARLESYRSAARSHGNWVSRRRMAWAAVCRGTAGGGTASG